MSHLYFIPWITYPLGSTSSFTDKRQNVLGSSASYVALLHENQLNVLLWLCGTVFKYWIISLRIDVYCILLLTVCPACPVSFGIPAERCILPCVAPIFCCQSAAAQTFFSFILKNIYFCSWCEHIIWVLCSFSWNSPLFWGNCSNPQTVQDVDEFLSSSEQI